MARIDTLPNFLTDVADAIREKKGTSDPILIADFDTEITNLPSGSEFSPTYISFYQFTGSDLSTMLEQIDASNIQNMNYMFSGCSNVTSIDLSSWHVTYVSSMQAMFSGCRSLQTLDLSNFENGNASIIMGSMFSNCISLTHLDMRSFTFTSINSYNSMFGYSETSRIPANCEIIVADQAQKNWLTSNFSWLTNVKTVAEYEAE